MTDKFHVHVNCAMKEEWGVVKEFIRSTKKHLDEGTNWRLAILGIVATIIVNAGVFVYTWGRLNVIVERHTVDIAESRKAASEEMKIINRKIDKLLYKIE